MSTEEELRRKNLTMQAYFEPFTKELTPLVKSIINSTLAAVHEQIEQKLKSTELKIGTEPMPVVVKRQIASNPVETSVPIIKRKPRMKRMILKPIKRKATDPPKNEEVKNEFPEPKNHYSWLTEKEREKWKYDWERKIEESESFTKKMRDIQKGIQQRKEAEYGKLLARIEKDVKTRHPKEIVEALEEQKAKREQERKEKFESKRKERMEILKLAKASVAKSKEIYQNIKSKIGIPELQKVKRSLAEKRGVYVKDPEMEEASERERKFQEILKKYSNEGKLQEDNNENLYYYPKGSKNVYVFNKGGNYSGDSLENHENPECEENSDFEEGLMV